MQVLMEVYNKLSKCDEFIPLAKSERYFATFRGRWCFLPTLPCLQLGFWKLPAKEMAVLATSIRKVARVLWALHVTFQEVCEALCASLLRLHSNAVMLNEARTSTTPVPILVTLATIENL